MEDTNDEAFPKPVVSMQDGAHQGDVDIEPEKSEGDIDSGERVEAPASHEQQVGISLSGKRTSLLLREAWPKSLLDDERDSGESRRTLVVCTIDVDNLNDTVTAMHTQIKMLRQTVLDLCQGAALQEINQAEEVRILRLKIGALESAPPPPASSIEIPRLGLMEERVTALEQTAARNKDSAAFEERLHNLETTLYGGDTAKSTASDAEANMDSPRSIAEPPEFSDGGEGIPVEDDEPLVQPTLPLGKEALCPMVYKLQRQVYNLMMKHNRSKELAAGLVALKTKLAELVTQEEEAEAQSRKAFVRLLRRAAFLRRMLIAEGIAKEGSGVTPREGDVWCTKDEEEDGGEKGDKSTDRLERRKEEESGGKQQTDVQDLCVRVYRRLIWLEAQAAVTLPGENSTAAGEDFGTDDGELREGSDRVDCEADINAGTPAKSARRSTPDAYTSLESSDGDGRRVADEANHLESTIGRMLDEASCLADNSKGSSEGATRCNQSLELVWFRMDEVERRICRTITDKRSLHLQMEQARARMESEAAAAAAATAAAAAAAVAAEAAAKAAAKAAAAATATAAAGIGSLDGDDQSRMEKFMTSAVTDQMSAIRLGIDGIADRVAALEEDAQLSIEGLTAEQMATVVHEAKEATQSQLNEEMLALDERVDKRAREEVRRLRAEMEAEMEAEEARNSMTRVSSTISSYTDDLAARLEGLQLDHERQGTEVARAADDIAAADASLKDLGSELFGLGQVANKVATAVDAKADQMDVEALKVAMKGLDAANNARGAAAATRDAEAIAALQVAFKTMSTSMEGSIRKLQQAQLSGGTIKMKPLLDQVIKELMVAGMLPDPDAGMGAVGRSQCLSCNRPITIAAHHQPSRSIPQFRGTLGSRMEKAASNPLQVNRTPTVWRGGFRMPQKIGNQPERLRSRTAGTSGGATHTRRLPSRGDDSSLVHRLPGISSNFDSVGGEGGSGVDGMGTWRGKMNTRLTTSAEAPYRGRFVPDSSNGHFRGTRSTASSNGRRM